VAPLGQGGEVQVEQAREGPLRAAPRPFRKVLVTSTATRALRAPLPTARFVDSRVITRGHSTKSGWAAARTTSAASE
jgi:hypothetical protein